MQVSDRGVQRVSKGEAEPRDTKVKVAKSLKMVRRSQSCRGITVSLEPGIESRTEDEVDQRGDSPVLVMHDGVTMSIFAHLIPAKGVDFPSCEKVVKMIVKDLNSLGYHRVVFRCDNEPSILALLQVVKLAWTGDVVEGTSAEGDPQSNGAAESSANVVKEYVRSIKLAVESASGQQTMIC